MGALTTLLVILGVGDVPERTRLWLALFDAGHVPLFGIAALLVRDLLRARGRAAAAGEGDAERESNGPTVEPNGRTSWTAFALTVALGGATEALQLLQPTRNVSLTDLLRDAAGAGAFLLIAGVVRGNTRPRFPDQWSPGMAAQHCPGAQPASVEGIAPAMPDDGLAQGTARGEKHSWPKGRRLAAVVAAAALLLAGGAELILTAAGNAARYRALPTLFPMDGSWWERPLIDQGQNRLTFATAGAAGDVGRQPASGVGPQAAGGRERQAARADRTGAADPANAGSASVPARFARLDLEPALYSGISFDEPYPDWRGYHRLVLTVASDLEAPLPIAIRIHDAAHDQRYADRFNRRLVVAPGVNRFEIPIDDIRRAPDRREMDMSRIRGIMIFVHRLEQPTHIYLGPIRLE